MDTEKKIEVKPTKKTVSTITPIVCLSLGLVVCFILLVVVVSHDSELNRTLNARDLEIEELKNNTPKCNQNLKTDEEINISNPNKIIDAASENGNIGDHIRGKADSKVLVVEYADMSCPGCAIMTPMLNEVYQKYGSKAAFVFRHYPISSHQNSQSAAEAVEGAGRQGKYWEMIDALYENRADWIGASYADRTNAYVKIFKRVAPNGDEEKFRSDLADKDITKKVNFDYKLGNTKSNVSATPSIFVNGELIDLSREDITYSDILKEIESKIEAGLAQ